jgi:FkbM family methyltransferase
MKRSLIVVAVAMCVPLVVFGGERERARRRRAAQAREAAAAAEPQPAAIPLARSLRAPEPQAGDLCPYLFDTPLGPFWYAERNKHGLELTLREQMADLYETQEVAIRPGDVVLDIGAFVGTFTRVALSKGAAGVWAIEPSAASAACLEKTFASEISAGRVHVLKVAAWSTKGLLRFEGGGIMFRVADTAAPGKAEPAAAPEASVEIPATTIDALIAEEGISRVDFIKMDIEGSEREALKGAATVIAQQGPKIAMALYHDNTAAARVVPDWVMIPHLILQARASYHVQCNETRREAFFFDPSARR